MITDDVNEGRRHKNLGDWEAQEDEKQGYRRLMGISGEIKQKGMPAFSYRLVHKPLQLKPQEITSICTWSESFRANPAGPPGLP